VEELPRNAAGKVLKRDLRDLYLEEVPDGAR
jgi:acyl-coenzyme A synthetase/AMP-(fatty) acid ligase